VVVVVLAGAIFIFVGGRRTSNIPEVVVEPTAAVVQDTVVVEQATATPQEEDTATVESQPVVPTPRTGLEATDPSTIVYASGGLLFVEAFDFY
jgi:hypothetical protein